MTDTIRPTGCVVGRRRGHTSGRPLLHHGFPYTGVGVPTAAQRQAAAQLTGVIAAGATVGIDESDLVHGLLDAVVAARPALVTSASLAAVLRLTATPEVATGRLAVRLIGGDLRPGADAFGGPRAHRALTAAACDVALVGGRLVGDAVWVPVQTHPERLALLLSARAAHVVLAPTDARPLPPDATPLARLAEFDGVVEVLAPDPAAHRSDAA